MGIIGMVMGVVMGIIIGIITSAWRNCFCLSGRGLRQRKQWTRSLPSSPPAIQEWATQLAVPGSEGGQSMVERWRGPTNAMGAVWGLGQEAVQPLNGLMQFDEDRTRPPWPTTWHNESRCMRLALKDWIGMLDVLHTRQRGHAVPPWNSPRATCLATIFPCEPVEPSSKVRKELLRMCQLMRRTQSNCLAHCISATCLIDKKSLAHGTRRFRRLEICDMIGGARATT